MVPYLPPAPFFGTGLHRCLFLLFEQSRALDPQEVGQAISWFTFREEFRFSQWAASMGPGFSAPAAVNGFYVEWEQCCDLYHLAARCRPPEQFLSPSQREAVQRDLALGTYTPQATKSLLDDEDEDDEEDEEEVDEYGEGDEEDDDEDGEEDGDHEDDVEDENEAARQGDDGDQRRGDSAAAESFQPSPEVEEEEKKGGPAEDSAASPEVEAVESPPQSESPRPPDLSVAEPEPCAAPSSAARPSRRSSCASRKKSESKALRRYLDALEQQRQRRDSEQVRGPPAPFNPERRLKRFSKEMRRMSAGWQPAVQTFLDETT